MNPQVILLAAGKSSRTWPIQEKTLVRFLGKTVLQHQIETLLAAGLSDICVVGNDENIAAFRDVCQTIPKGDFTFAIQKDLDEGIRGGILAAEAVIDTDRPILVVCSNDMVEKSAYEITLAAAEKSKSSIYLVGKVVDNYFPGGYLSLAGGHSRRITHIVEKPGAGNEPSDLVTILVHLFREPQTLLQALHQVPNGDQYEETLQTLFDQGEVAEAVSYSGFWQPIKYPWHLLDVQDYFLQTLTTLTVDPSAKVSPQAVISGNVVVASGAKIMDFAVISGPAYIGKNTVVANHALVRGSIIEDDCVIGHTTEVARSTLQSHCWTHQNFVGDSIFDVNVSLGAGTRTANLRLDEQNIYSIIKQEKICSEKVKFGSIIGKNVRIGINSSLLPGVKIGGGSFLGAGGIYSEDIPEDRFVYPTQTILERKNTRQTSVRDRF